MRKYANILSMKKKYRIVKDNAISLRAKAKAVDFPLSQKDKDFAFDLLDFLVKTKEEKFCQKNKVREGVGLAAPQLGKNLRIIAINYEIEDKKIRYLLINPKIIEYSLQKCYLKGGEGCLSVDKKHPGYVYRHHKIIVQAYNLLTEQQETIIASGFDAVVLQHEIDHLDGVLFYDHIDIINPYKKIDNAVEI